MPNDAGGADDNTTPEPAAARQKFLPSSMGLSLLVPPSARQLAVTVRWGDYRVQRRGEGQSGPAHWRRSDRQQQVTIDLPDDTQQPIETEVSKSAGLQLALSVRRVRGDGEDVGLPSGTRSVSVFLVNRRRPAADDVRDEAFAFQAELEVASREPFVPRPNVRCLESNDWDERVADLQYRDAGEFAVGHSVATTAFLESDGSCFGHPWGSSSARDSTNRRPTSPVPFRLPRRCWWFGIVLATKLAVRSRRTFHPEDW